MRSAGLNKDSMAKLLGFNWITRHLNVLTEGPIGTGNTKGEIGESEIQVSVKNLCREQDTGVLWAELIGKSPRQHC